MLVSRRVLIPASTEKYQPNIRNKHVSHMDTYGLDLHGADLVEKNG